ncbi:hypothetical protein SDRG_09783 [Saprolegnia diclina VS20]|uniref:Uncharacterized protein n=1 Tax=Saprolegnia diclina (strain VS20) TaxID=1156394 RepID=T0QCQ8_SAPDV|nr:hypothetical protein SDRG_09783 [Saprolegnia diclina VS20]EQC32456.1 hypothetical protein SDRG_09783 [Saprolegnia diclina VS20]|eukprot:XP_008613957.1 hypothetical protein SDRG_09783 [Saprolegnia diclina VS20]
MASSVLRSPELMETIVSYQEGLPQDLVVIQRLADAVALTPCRLFTSDDEPGYLANVPVRFGSLPYLQRYPHPTTKLPHHALFVSPYFYDRALALHLSVVEGDVALVQRWLRWDASLCTSATLELAAAASQGPILRLLFEQFPALATPKMMDLVAMSGDLELLMWLHEAGAICSTAAMDGAAMNGHYDSVVFLHSARTEGCTIEAANGAAVNGHASIARFLLEQRTEGVNPSLWFKPPHREHLTHSVRGESHIEAVDLVAATVALTEVALAVVVENADLVVMQHVYARGYLKRMTKRLLELAVFNQDHAMLRYVLACVDQENPRPPSDDEWLPHDVGRCFWFDRWDNCQVMEAAAFNGDMTSLELLHKSRLRVGSERAIVYAAYGGHMHVLDWLLKYRNDGCADDAMALAAAAGHFDVVRWLHEVYGLWRTNTALATAAYIGHMAMVTYLLSVPTGGVDNQSDRADGFSTNTAILPTQEGYPYHASNKYAVGSAVSAAASQGHFDILKLLVARGHQVQPTAINEAVSNGHLTVVRYLHESFGQHCSLQSLLAAFWDRHIDTMTYVLSHRCWQVEPNMRTDQGFDRMMHSLFLAAAHSGSLTILQLVCDALQLQEPTTRLTQLPRHVSERMMLRAAAHGHLDMLRHLHDVFGFAWTEMVQAVAYRHNRKNVRRYLSSLGFVTFEVGDSPVAVAFVAVAAYGACIAALAGSMYAELLALPDAILIVTSVIATIVAAIGLVHLVSTRGNPSYSVCLCLLFVVMVCCCTLLAYAIKAISLNTNAIETAPMLTTYQHLMEAYYASEKARKFEYVQTLSDWSRWSKLFSDEYPRKAANAFTDAYCVSQGHRFCGALPLVQTILFPGVWPQPNVTAEIARTFSTLPATFLNVTVTSSTTINSFCAAVNQTSLLHNESMLGPVAIQRASDFKSDLSNLCRGCAALSSFSPVKSNGLERWIHSTASCSSTALSYYSSSYLNPSFDACFGHALMSGARPYILTTAIASGAVTALLLLLSARLWVLRRVVQARLAMAGAVVHTPVDSA